MAINPIAIHRFHPIPFSWMMTLSTTMDLHPYHLNMGMINRTTVRIGSLRRLHKMIKYRLHRLRLMSRHFHGAQGERGTYHVSLATFTGNHDHPQKHNQTLIAGATGKELLEMKRHVRSPDQRASSSLKRARDDLQMHAVFILVHTQVADAGEGETSRHTCPNTLALSDRVHGLRFAAL